MSRLRWRAIARCLGMSAVMIRRVARFERINADHAELRKRRNWTLGDVRMVAEKWPRRRRQCQRD